MTAEMVPGYFERLEALNQFHPDVPEKAFYLQNIAINASLRGNGIGEQLFRSIVVWAQNGHHETMQLDVVSDNPAVKFYIRLGMEIKADTDVPELRTKYDQPSRYRMVLAITPSD
jgi:ribosomal protein S18 acetylase RimI-like enzyme